MSYVYVTWAGDGSSTFAIAQKFSSKLQKYFDVLQNGNGDVQNLVKCSKKITECDKFATGDSDSKQLSKLSEIAKGGSLGIFFISTSSHGSPPTGAKIFYKKLQDLAKNPSNNGKLLNGLLFVIVCFGDSQFGEEYFCTPGINIDKCLFTLGATRISKPILIDRRFDELSVVEDEIFDKLLQTITDYNNGVSISHINDVTGNNGEVCDIEDFVTNSKNMLSDIQKKNLIREGYKIIGLHSAVKLCRWTKAHLRGRGGCYKHTFYGIISSRCMEMTPSLACANKCVFCWRHHTNPVGTKWKWETDNPQFIAHQAEVEHVKMIKELKGILGVRNDRFESAQQIRHCALSLVGEPIMYPHINDLLYILHSKQISTFLVTNAQFPDLLNTLNKVTQLYLSIDAFDEKSLKRIDRPLFSDFWQRFQQSINILSTRTERTVFRLTLVKQFNMTEQADELNDLAKLVELGKPCFIEIKGVTYCGAKSDITMENVPWHDQVVNYVKALMNTNEWIGANYGISCQHRHSCSVLIANKKFYIDGKWYTWIDYDRFHWLVNSGQEFGPLDYAIETPEWALFNSEHEGFNPHDTRWYRNNSSKSLSKCNSSCNCNDG